MYEFNLPNGWWITLSNARAYSANMDLYEGRGVPPDQEVSYTVQDFEARQDPLITQAVKYLQADIPK